MTSSKYPLLILFDLDGTLLAPESGADAERAFWDGLAATLGIRDLVPQWIEDLEHVSCRGVANKISSLRQGRGMTDAEIAALSDAYHARLQASTAPAAAAMSGAATLLARIDAVPDMAWAIATGCFARTARLKLARAGLPADAVLAASDDGEARTDILRTAVARAEARFGRRFASMLAVGDGPWDVRAADALSFGFIGIARGAHAEALVAAGAAHIRPHFDPPEAFLALARAVIGDG
jgi:phosphoglycolate phosphatase-like HAD superfamily hydrolase